VSDPVAAPPPASGADEQPMLQVRDLRVSYGAIEAVKGITFDVHRGQVVTLIGGNGAGKTTTLRTISGLLRAASGQVIFEGERIDRRPGHLILRKGIAQSPEGRRIFAQMTIRENLELGAFSRKDDGVEADIDHVYELFPVLGERRTQKAGTLSGGEQQMLAMGRAMMSRPRRRWGCRRS
jgi:branched-chain amino acid transport system ATP-binding protein